MNKTLMVGGIIIVLILAGIYFFTRRTEVDDLVVQRNQLESNLITAQSKLSKEKQTLNSMTSSLSAYYPLAMDLEDEMSKASDLVGQTDFMFTNANGANPELILKNPLTSILINQERKAINLLLEEWKKKTTTLSMSTMGVLESERIKKEAEMIKNYIEHLNSIVASLTPENSGLSQSEIYTYISQLPTVVAIDEVLNSLTSAIENSNNPISPPVTTTDVIVQQEVVVESQREVAHIQEQITRVEQQIEQTSPTQASASTPIPVTTGTPNPTPSAPSPAPVPAQRIKYQGIITQPGPPRLIPGSDPF